MASCDYFVLGNPEHRPFEILRACLWVVDNLRFQCRYKEALSLHPGIHRGIMNLVGPDHELAILSKQLLGSIRRVLGEHESEIAIYRELLQFPFVVVRGVEQKKGCG